MSDYFRLGKVGLLPDLKLLLGYFGGDELIRFINLIEAFSANLPEVDLAKFERFSFFKKKDDNDFGVGQLSMKEEAAGKIRVFALVDIWTQSVLKPLHDGLFSFLKSLPNDGTFDQHASVRRCFEKSKLANCSYGYDLSAATDRLPISLQVAILSALIGLDMAEA